MKRNFCITSKDLYHPHASIYEIKDNRMDLVKKHVHLPSAATTTTTTTTSAVSLPYKLKDMLPFVFHLSLNTVIRSFIIDGNYRDLANLAFVNTESLETVYDRVFCIQFRKDKLSLRFNFGDEDTDEEKARPFQKLQITRLAKTFKLLDTLLTWFQGTEEYGFLEPSDFVYFQFQPDPNPSWKRKFEPWDFCKDFVVELSSVRPVFQNNMSYKIVNTGTRLGDRAIVSGIQTDGLLQVNYYRHPVVCIKACDKFGNCQGTKTIFKSSDNWKAVSCLLRACLGRDAGIFFLVDSNATDLDLQFTFLNGENVFYEHNPGTLIRSSIYRNLLK